jgi:ubiquinone/menaquinone biosynthesis C-methylase UbiE
MRFGELKNNWEDFGTTQPFSAVLTDFEETDQDEFFALGRREIEDLVGLLQQVGWTPRGRALDFGSGLGRLSQALSAHFESVLGVDVAQSMVDKATSLNTSNDHCRFLVNTQPDLSIVPTDSIDLVYTNLVLQHMAPQYEAAYIREFFRVVKPSGIVAFQVCDPVRGQLLKAYAPEWLLRPYRRLQGKAQGPAMQMYGMSESRITRLVASVGSRVLLQKQMDSPGYPGRLYLCRGATSRTA